MESIDSSRRREPYLLFPTVPCGQLTSLSSYSLSASLLTFSSHIFSHLPHQKYYMLVLNVVASSAYTLCSELVPSGKFSNFPIQCTPCVILTQRGPRLKATRQAIAFLMTSERHEGIKRIPSLLAIGKPHFLFK